MVSYRFDLYPRTDPKDGTLIRSFTHLQKAAYRAEANGTSTGQIAVRSSTDDGQAIDPLGLQYVRVAELPGGTVRGGFFLEKGKFAALSEDEDHLLTFSGAGTLSYLSRASMAPFTYLSNDIDAGLGAFDDAMDPFDDTWRLYAQGFGNYLGSMLWRVVKEATLAPSGPYTHRHVQSGTTSLTVEHDADRPASAIPAVTLTFDYETDSSGNPWTLTSGEFKARVGENLLSVVKRLMEAGLYVELDPDTFELRAWEQDTHRAMLDATGSVWSPTVVRFQSPTDGTLDTANIKDDAERNIEAHIRRSALWAGGSDVYGLATSPSDIPWEGFYGADVADTAALEGIAAVQLQAIAEAGDTLKLRLWMEDDPEQGQYLPWDHVLLDQQVTVHTGSDQWEYNERTFPVAALTVELKPAGNWDCIVELGASYSSAASRQFQVAGAGAHTHPPNPQLCEPTIGDLLRGLSGASVKVSGELGDPYWAESANDGDITTHWSDFHSTVPESYWAADLGSAREVIRYRIAQGLNTGGVYDGIAHDETTADEVRIYGSNASAAWTWLPADQLSADPAANGWTLVETDVSGASLVGDTGSVDFGAAATYRYWLFRAISGGSGLDSWDVHTLSLFGEQGNPEPLALDGEGSHGFSNRATRCDHAHEHGDLSLSIGPHHTAGAIGITDPGDNFTGSTVEAALQELAAGSDGLLHIYDPRAYGATADGLADDTSALQDAIDAAEATGGVVNGAGKVYRITNTLEFLSNSRVMVTNLTLKFGASVTAVKVAALAGGGAHGVIFDHVYWWSTSTTGTVGLLIEDQDRVTVRASRIDSCAIGIDLHPSTEWVEGTSLSDVWITGCTTGIRFFGSGGTHSFHETSLRNVGINACTIGIDIQAQAEMYRGDWTNVTIWPSNGGTGIIIDGQMEGFRAYIGFDGAAASGGSCTGFSIGINATGLDELDIWTGYAAAMSGVTFTPVAGAQALAFRYRIGHSSRWEPVTNGDSVSPEVVFHDGDIVMEWVI